METLLTKYFRIPENLFRWSLIGRPAGQSGFFKFGPDTICYGACANRLPASKVSELLYDASSEVSIKNGNLCCSFAPDEVVDNLRHERYRASLSGRLDVGLINHSLVRRAYYAARELLPISVRRHLQRVYFRGWRDLRFPKWPVDTTVDNLHNEFLRLSMVATGIARVPFVWFWPEGAASCLIMTHDVETASGVGFTPQLMSLDEAYGFKASFQVIPEERYKVADAYVREIRNRGFEFNIHDLNHDGQLFRDHKEFQRRVVLINEYARRYQARGFRSGAMYRNQDWFSAFEFSYDMSVPTVAHLEPMRGGCCTVMPYFVGKILELPLTTAQDYSMLYILNEVSIDLWKAQIALIRNRNGLMSFITHPDYLVDRRGRKLFEALLDYLGQLVQREKIWTPLPGEVDQWWRARSEMKLVRDGENWKIEGPGSERARLAFATIEDNHITYHVE